MVNDPAAPAVPANVNPLLFTPDAKLKSAAWADPAATAIPRTAKPTRERERRRSIGILPSLTSGIVFSVQRASERMLTNYPRTPSRAKHHNVVVDGRGTRANTPQGIIRSPSLGN